VVPRDSGIYPATGTLLYPISLLALANIDPIEQGMCDIIMIMDWLAEGENRNRPNSKTSKNG